MIAEWVRAMFETGGQTLTRGNGKRKFKNSYRFGTVKALLHDITYFLYWAELRNINLYTKFSNLEGFTKIELRDFFKLLHSKKKNKEGENRNKFGTINRRILSANSFTLFHLNRYTERKSSWDSYSNVEKFLMRQQRNFTNLMYSKSDVDTEVKPLLALDEKIYEVIADILHPDSEMNPYRTYKIKMRNFCMFHLWVETGMRRSELVLLELDDVNEQLPLINIKYPCAKTKNERKDGANLKTKCREVGITDELHKVLGIYKNHSRDEILNGKLSRALFPSTKDGKRLSADGASRIFKMIEKVECFKGELNLKLSPHMLRKRSAVKMREKTDGLIPSTSPLIQTGVIQDMMTYQYGWSSQSDMPRYYAKEAIVERARKALREINNKNNKLKK